MRHQELSRDSRITILSLHQAGFTSKAISEFFEQNRGFEISQRQILRAISQGHPTPQKKGKCGRHSILTEEQVDEIEPYIRSSKATRFTSYLSLIEGPLAHLNVSADTIRHAMVKRGYKRYVARQKPPLSDKNKRLRL